MDISPVFFYAFAAIAIACALLVVINKSPITSAFSLVLVFFAFAGIYAMLDAHLIATLQVLVYAGAIMVLFVFVIMLLNSDKAMLERKKHHPVVVGTAVVAGLALLAVFVWVFKNTKSAVAPGPYSVQNIEMAGGNTRVISELMFSEWILPFELTSILLLAAIVGAVAIAKRQRSATGAKSASPASIAGEAK